MLDVRFEHFGPKRPEVAFVPPPGMRLQEYVLAYDEKLKRTLYVVAHDYGAAFGDVFSFDGKEWTQLAKGSIAAETKQKLDGFYDTNRECVVTWNFNYDYDAGRARASGFAIDGKTGKLTPLESSGADPIAEKEGDDSVGTFDYYGLFAHDRKRKKTVCLTRFGVWECDAKGVWTHATDIDIPKEWNDDGAGATWDPQSQRTVFWVFTREPKYEYAFWAWDGKTLERLPVKGLPMDVLHMGLFNPAATITAHLAEGVSTEGARGTACPPHLEKGIVLVCGPQTFTFDGKGWKEGPKSTGDCPPRLKNARMAHHADGDLFVVGPAYHENDGGGREMQRTFFVRTENVWKRMGAVSVPSLLGNFYGGGEHGMVGGVWYSAGRSDAHTVKWTDEGFVEIVSKEDGDKMLARTSSGAGDRVLALLDVEGVPTIVSTHGSVLSFEKGAWKKVCPMSKPFGGRTEAPAAYDPLQKRIVVWGGSVNNRPSNDTWFFANGTWTKAKKSSPMPKDKRGRNAEFVDFVMFWDTALQRMVRLGHKDVAVLEDDVWRSLDVKGFSKLLGPRHWQHVPLHDPKSGETLLLHLQDDRQSASKVVRFDLAGCVEVATVAKLPDEIQPKQQHDSAAMYAIKDDLCFDAQTRTLHAQHAKENTDRYALDLGAAFDAAVALGARKLLGAARSAKVAEILYDPKTGKSAKKGVAPDALSLDVLAKLAGLESQSLSVGKKVSKLTAHATSRLGGLPTGVTAKRWPHERKKPMGFLLQLDTGKRLKKHAGVAVFCRTDGTATEDEDGSQAVLITKADWKKKPIAAAPDGSEVAAMQEISVGEPCFELDEARVDALVAKDPNMAGAFERFQAKAKVQKHTSSKLGGAPEWLQDVGMSGKYVFLAQIDFDSARGPDWGLAGCVYVFVHPSEKDAVAIWQYT